MTLQTVIFVTILYNNREKFIDVTYDDKDYYIVHGEKIYRTDYELKIVDRLNDNSEDVNFNYLCQDNIGYYIYNEKNKTKFSIPDDMQSTIQSYIHKLLCDMYLRKYTYSEITW
jgi:hypothetical protein